MLRCRLLGHRFRFTGEGDTMVWRCERGCEAEGSKRYESAERAAFYARGLDRRDDLGRRAPYFGLFPLRLWHAMRRKSSR